MASQFKIYLADNDALEIPLSIARESNTIKNFIDDNPDNLFKLPAENYLIKTALTSFFTAYSKLVNDHKNELSTDLVTLLTYLEIADYFDCERIWDESTNQEVNLVDFLINKFVRGVISQRVYLAQSQELNLLRSKYTNLASPLQILIKETIRSLVVKVPVIRQESIIDLKRQILTTEDKIFNPEWLIYKLQLITDQTEVFGYAKWVESTEHDHYTITRSYQNLLSNKDNLPDYLQCFRQSVYHNELKVIPTPINNLYLPAATVPPIATSLSNLNTWESVNLTTNFNHTYHWLSYYNNCIYLNQLKIVNNDITVTITGPNFTKKQTLIYTSLYQFSATKYNRYIFGPLGQIQTVFNNAEEIIPWQIEDADDKEFYARYNGYEVIVIIDLMTNQEQLKLFLSVGQYYYVDDKGQYLLTVSRQRQIIELYNIQQKKRVLKRSFSQFFASDILTNGKAEILPQEPIKDWFLLDNHNKLIYTFFSVKYKLYNVVMNFRGQIVNQNLGHSPSAYDFHPMKSGHIDIIHDLDNWITLTLKNPVTYEVIYRFQPLSLNYRNSGISQLWPRSYKSRIAISPSGENVVFIGDDQICYFKLFPNNQPEYQSLEALLDKPS